MLQKNTTTTKKKKSKKKSRGHLLRNKGPLPKNRDSKPLRNRSRKNAETSLLEPIKKKEIGPKPCETAARKLPKRCFWNLRKMPKREKCRCETAARKLPKRCFWNLLKTKKKPASHQTKLKKKVFKTRMRKSRTPAGFVPKPLRNRSRKNLETSLLEPTKNKEI